MFDDTLCLGTYPIATLLEAALPKQFHRPKYSDRVLNLAVQTEFTIIASQRFVETIQIQYRGHRKDNISVR